MTGLREGPGLGSAGIQDGAQGNGPVWPEAGGGHSRAGSWAEGLLKGASLTLACLPWSRKRGQSKVHPAGNGASRMLLCLCCYITLGIGDLALGTGRGGPWGLYTS